METQPIYNCTQEEEILVARTMWNSCLKYRDPYFTGFSASYTVALITARQLAITAAEELPNEEQRQEAETTARIHLAKSNTQGCKNWQLLKRYIAKAYSPDLHQAKWNAAGMAEYEKAYEENWESSKDLMRLGNTFITANLATLTAAENMPDEFQDTFAAAKLDFDTKLTIFITAEQTNKTGGQTKIQALNAVHTDLMPMALDGQEIDFGNEGIKDQFIFEQVLKLYAGTSAQGFKGEITNSITNTKIKGAKVTIQDTAHTNTSDPQGNYAMRNVAAGENKTIIIECEGFITQTIPNNTVETAKMTTLNIALVPNP